MRATKKFREVTGSSTSYVERKFGDIESTGWPNAWELWTLPVSAINSGADAAEGDVQNQRDSAE